MAHILWVDKRLMKRDKIQKKTGKIFILFKYEIAAIEIIVSILINIKIEVGKWYA